jgi:outer membrane murein-binding lipoprotein Lpp
VTLTSKISCKTSVALPCGGSLTSVRRWPRRLRKYLTSGVALASLLVAGTVVAKADDASTAELAAEIHALKAQLQRLESRVNSQQVRIKAVMQQGPVYKGPPVAYEPPQPWDKKFHLNGITMTPGGFFAMEGVWRSRDTGGDFSPPFGQLNNYTSPLSHLNELRGTARQSRVSMLVQGNYNPDTLISGYGELDFLGAAPTANSNESDSYQPRIRVMYSTIDWMGEGFHVLAGQNWSLLTLQGKGITPRNELIPLTIDAQYVAGFNWARQPQVRITKNFGDSFWLAGSAEMPQTTGCPSGVPSGTATPGLSVPVNALNGNGVVCNQYPSGGSGALNPYQYYSFNHVPDVIVKAAWEPTIADRTIHVEGFGLYTDLYDFVENDVSVGSGVTTTSPSFNNSRYDNTGWGAGGGIIIPVLPKLVDLQGTGMIGRGIGRYGSAQLNGASFDPDGALNPLPEAMVLGGAVVHATPWLDLYAYGGGERILSADYFGVSGTGVVAPTADNSGCYFVNGVCKGKVQEAWEITGGFWGKLYTGAFGTVKAGLQYAYIQNDLFPGSGDSQGPANYDVKYNNQMVYASFRYYPFDPPPPAPPLPVVAKY